MDAAPPEILVAFGDAVRTLRRQRGLSQERLAEEADIHRTYIGDVERGQRNIALVNIDKIARALGIALPTLMALVEANRRKDR